MPTKPASTTEQVDRMSEFSTPFAPSPHSPAVPSEMRQPDAATPHYLPRDLEMEAVLNKGEKLLRRGRFDSVLREINRVKPGEDALGSAYALMLADQAVRAHLGRGDRLARRGETKDATSSYKAALKPAMEHPAVAGVYQLTTKAIDTLSRSRADLVEKLLGQIDRNEYSQWCELRKGIIDASILRVPIEPLIPDISFEDVYGPRRPEQFPPSPAAGWDRPDGNRGNPLADVTVDTPSITPALSFEADTTRPLAVSDLIAELQPATTTTTNGFIASATGAMPLIGSLIRVRARMHALAGGLDMLGAARASTPLLHYTYLRQDASRILDEVDTIDQQMMTAQLKLDDIAELIETIRRQIQQQTAELQSVNTKIGELSTLLTTLKQGEGQLRETVQQLENAADDCDTEWWEVLVSVLVVVGSVAIGALVGGFIGSAYPGVGTVLGAVAGGVVALVTSIIHTVNVWQDKEINCDKVAQAKQDFQQAHQDIKTAITDVRAELDHALLIRDALTTELASLEHTYAEAVASNEGRVLNSATLGRVISTLDSVRGNLLFRAHNLAGMAQSAYNFENDAEVALIRDSYVDYLEPGTKGYTAAAALRRDLDGIEYIRTTARTRKQIQLTHVMSLREHQPVVFAALLMSGSARFATRLEDFDRWYPGTYLQRLREVRVEVVLDGPAAGGTPIRGYLTNGGVSQVRFLDVGNKTEVDNRDIFAESDPDLVKLCCKRRRRQHAVETMAFPQLSSPLADARDVARQVEERNHFENCGLETTWTLELLPNQQISLSQIRDVRLHFQYDAAFDATLKRVTEAKRFIDRHETALISARQLFSELDRPLDLTAPVAMRVSNYQFEAPQLAKTIDKVAIMLRPKGSPILPGKAKLRITFEQSSPIEVETNDMGLVATSEGRPAGTDTDTLQALVSGKDVAGLWTIEVLSLPDGLTVADIEDLMLILNYQYQPE